MVRRAAFPLSRTPASIEHSMKLLRLRPDGAGGVLGRPSVCANRMEALAAALGEGCDGCARVVAERDYFLRGWDETVEYGLICVGSARPGFALPLCVSCAYDLSIILILGQFLWNQSFSTILFCTSMMCEVYDLQGNPQSKQEFINNVQDSAWPVFIPSPLHGRIEKRDA